MVTRPADEAVLPVTQEMPTHLPPVVITIDTTSAVVSGPAGNPTLDAPESDADGDSEENIAMIAPPRRLFGEGFFVQKTRVLRE